MIYYSKKDAWLVAVVLACILSPVFVGLFLLFATDGHWVAGATALYSVVIVLLVLLLTYPLYYEITPLGLTIRCGILVRKQIPIDSIREVFPTRNPLSAPAWSLDRLRVNYEINGEVGSELISPKDKPGFMQELVGLGAGLKLQGERVVRA
jgi:membrane protein YdbS with pleckstrin-like domain